MTVSTREQLLALVDQLECKAEHKGFMGALDLLADMIRDLRAFEDEEFTKGVSQPAGMGAETPGGVAGNGAEMKPAVGSGKPGEPGVSCETTAKSTAANPVGATSLRTQEIAIWRAIPSLITDGFPVSHATISRRAGVRIAGIGAYLRILETAGLIRMDGYGRGRRYAVLQQPPEDATTEDEDPAPVAAHPPTRNQSRFPSNHSDAPEQVMGLAEDHRAVVQGRSLFPSTVVAPGDSPRILVSGKEQRKLGDRVTKGPWAGMRIYALSLEERATCPKTCHHWLSCYGNGMPRARRHAHGPQLEELLGDEIKLLNRQHPGGFVVRAHVLGDFYSVGYVEAWELWLDAFPALHVFGTTAWPRDSDIGGRLNKLTSRSWDRFAIRFSAAEPSAQGATTIWREPEAPRVPEGIVCPAETGRTANCGTCGLCWAPNARKQTIVFVAHGRKTGPRKKLTRALPDEGKGEAA